MLNKFESINSILDKCTYIAVDMDEVIVDLSYAVYDKLVEHRDTLGKYFYLEDIVGIKDALYKRDVRYVDEWLYLGSGPLEKNREVKNMVLNVIKTIDYSTLPTTNLCLHLNKFLDKSEENTMYVVSHTIEGTADAKYDLLKKIFGDRINLIFIPVKYPGGKKSDTIKTIELDFKTKIDLFIDDDVKNIKDVMKINNIKYYALPFFRFNDIPEYCEELYSDLSNGDISQIYWYTRDSGLNLIKSRDDRKMVSNFYNHQSKKFLGGDISDFKAMSKRDRNND